MTNPTATKKHVPADAILLSRTDRRGIITSSNSAFTEMTGYETEERLKSPHRIVRHDNMPKCIFHLLWAELLEGRAIGAYAKNRCKNGAQYWVFAAITPAEDGFLSVRTSAHPEEVKNVAPIYAKLAEQEENLMTYVEIIQFRAQSDRFETVVQDSLTEITKELARLIDGSARIKRNLSGLPMTKVMCAIENTKIPENQASSVGAIIAELGHLQEQTEERLRAIGAKLTAIEDSISKIAQRKAVELAKAS